MRTSRSLLAVVGRSSQFLTPGSATGLTGIANHSAPRPHLIYLYKNTLEKLQKLPETSVYRKSVEALTRQRLAIVEGTVPSGFDAWQERIKKQIQDVPFAFGPGGLALTFEHSGKTFALVNDRIPVDDRVQEWDGEIQRPKNEGLGTEEDNNFVTRAEEVQAAREHQMRDIEIEKEPPLTIDQISDIENRIGSGLIEEVVAVAEGEMQLVDTMAENKVWEELEEKPVEGQWDYFSRDTHVLSTQSP